MDSEKVIEMPVYVHAAFDDRTCEIALEFFLAFLRTVTKPGIQFEPILIVMRGVDEVVL
jgi:hypothetical protein